MRVERPRLLKILGGLAAAIAVGGHVAVVQQGPDAAPALLAVDHLYQIFLAGSVVALSVAVGERLLGLSGAGNLRPPDRLLFGAALGAGALSVVLLAAGLTGLLSPPVFLVVLVLAAGWARRELAGLARLLGRVREAVPRPVLVAAAVMGVALLLRGIMPPTDWDSLMYHLHLPSRFLEEGRIFLPSDTLHVAYVGLVHMLYLPLLALGGSSASALLSLAFGLLLPLAVYRLARRVAGPTSAEVAGVAIWGTTAVALVAVTARVDVTLLLFLTLAHAALYDALAGDGDRGRLLLAAVLLGAAVGVKYQAGAYVLALSPLIAWAALEGGPSGGRLRWGGLAAFAGVAAVVALPWFAKNWLLLEAPFYPFLADRLLPTWLAGLHGSRVVPDAVDPAVFGALAEVRRPFDLVDAFLQPGRLSPEAEAAHYHPSPLLLVLPASLAWIRDRSLAWLLVPGLGYVALVLAASPRTNLRYLLPAVPPLTVAASILAVRLARWGAERLGEGVADPGGGAGEGADPAAPHRRRLRAGALALAVASLIPTGVSLYQWLPDEVSLAYLAGRESRTAYLSQRRDPAMVARAGLTDFGEQPLPEDARVLMLFEAREHHFDVPAVQDPLLTNWSLLAPLRGRLDCLRATDVTHVLVGTGVLEYYVRRGLDPKTVRWPSFRDFARRCLETTLEAPGFRLYRVGPAGVETPDGR